MAMTQTLIQWYALHTSLRSPKQWLMWLVGCVTPVAYVALAKHFKFLPLPQVRIGYG